MISTDTSYVLNLTLLVYTRDGKPYVMPFNVTVLEPVINVTLNMAPFFNKTPSS